MSDLLIEKTSILILKSSLQINKKPTKIVLERKAESLVNLSKECETKRTAVYNRVHSHFSYLMKTGFHTYGTLEPRGRVELKIYRSEIYKKIEFRVTFGNKL